MDKNYGGGDQTRSTRLVDISPFFLVEATGDSEGDFDHRNLMKLMMDGLIDSSYDDDDDDCHDGNGHDDDSQSSCCHGNVCDDASTSSSLSSSSLSNGKGGRKIIIHHHDNQDHHHDGQCHDGHDDAGHDDDDDDDDDVIKGGKGLASTWKGCNSKFKMVSCSRHHDYEHGHGKVTSDVMSTANSHSSRKSSSSCADSREGKKMSEKERSRLFWETCLAS